MPKVWNINNPECPKNATYIGRPSPAGNPFVIGKDGTRSEVIDKFREYFYANEELMEWSRENLRGKDLACFCKPNACHGDIILEYVNSEPLEFN